MVTVMKISPQGQIRIPRKFMAILGKDYRALPVEDYNWTKRKQEYFDLVDSLTK